MSFVRAPGEMEGRHLPALRRRHEIPASYRTQYAAVSARHPSEADESSGPLETQSRLNKPRVRCVEISSALALQ
jgi:hypothetical protein